MKILKYSIGDSHADFTFRGIIENRRNIGPLTMHRIGRDKINLLDYFIDDKKIEKDSFIIISFGEIDVRCHIYNQIHINNRSEDEVIKTLVDNYFEHILSQKNLFKKIILLNINPPAKKELSANNSEYPFVGSNQDRSRYTKKINNYLKNKSIEHDIGFIETHKYYSDSDGMLICNLSDGSVHINEQKYILKEIEENHKYLID